MKPLEVGTNEWLEREKILVEDIHSVRKKIVDTTEYKKYGIITRGLNEELHFCERRYEEFLTNGNSITYEKK